MVPNCAPGDEYIRIGNATSDTIEIEPKRPVLASVTGFIYEVPDALITICPGKTSSPLDLLVQSYIKGRETFVYVRGGSLTSPTLPDWLEAILQSVIVPVSIPSKGLSNLIKRFSMSHVHFFLPEPSAKPDAPEAQPRVSALVQALVDLPQEMNVPVNVSRVRTVADVYYHSKKLGYIDLQKWQNATALSTLGIEIPVPKLRLPDQNGDGDDDGDNPDGGDGPHFIKDATMHLWTSTAEFTLLSPLTETTLFITSVHATALYNSTSPVGRIQYNSPFPVPPGVSITPRLPVELDFGGAGYEALKKALGGSLEIDAVADIGVKLGEYMDTISYWGKGIGAKVRL
ncbi:hypothetical protein CISG_03045 [Coccidioides immitis RMSCC 3703]|uniref:Uncharacterized protein n=1 Tax=Coccidioides immitis RMSCC 3703 TaxID=454286 RepID=A0A0J8TFI3_COCIT|nr:hypothetical protein CISG_03045 [Coccidioides immitis RMSCC 3703]